MVCEHEHQVQFYDSEEFLSAAVCAFLAPALRDANAAIVVATAAHRRALDRFDGSGYPRGLSGADIPLEGRVAAVADVFDALTSETTR